MCKYLRTNPFDRKSDVFDAIKSHNTLRRPKKSVFKCMQQVHL